MSIIIISISMSSKILTTNKKQKGSNILESCSKYFQ